MKGQTSHSLRFYQWTILAFAGFVLFSVTGSAQDAPLEPQGQIYFGAYVNPSGQGESVQAVKDLETGINRTFALNVHHYEWTELGENFPSSLEKDDFVYGRVPVVSWNCGIPNAMVASGSADMVIMAAAHAIQSYGNPVFLRYMDKMNLSDAATNRTACHGASDNADGSFSPQDFIAAWKHIRDVFACPNLVSPCQPVTNVIWVWNPASTGAPFADYYPGDNEVDWLGIDAFDSQQPSTDDQFSETINPAYSELTSLAPGKPIVLETAALHGNQAAYLFLDDPVRSLKNNFPEIKALIYHDTKASDFDWTLDNKGGFCAFVILGETQYLSAFTGVRYEGTPPPLCCTCMLPGSQN